MKFSMKEVASLFFALNQTKDGKPRQYQFIDLAKIQAIAEQMDSCIEDEKIPDKDHEMEFSAEQRTFLLEKVREQDWQMGDAKTVIELEKKLSE